MIYFECFNFKPSFGLGSYEIYLVPVRFGGGVRDTDEERRESPDERHDDSEIVRGNDASGTSEGDDVDTASEEKQKINYIS